MARNKVWVLLILFCLSHIARGYAGEPVYYYRVYFTDKGNHAPEDFTLTDLFSSKAVERRLKNGNDNPDIKDLPVNNLYLDNLKAFGLKLHCTSRWMNTALFKSAAPADLNEIEKLAFIKEIKTVRQPVAKGVPSDKLFFEQVIDDIIPYDRPVTMVNGYPLINSGFNGKGILIAVLDGGFENGNQVSSLAGLRQRKGIRSERNFVDNDNSVYQGSTHGTAVLSILAGSIENLLLGTAQGADYLLLRTEDTASEFPCEEDFWVAGAEYADSCGADIISSSLGYSTFDYQAMNYKIDDLNGNTSFVTRAADIAASRGMLVVNSAGNERNKSWKKIICPADADSVLAIGAVDGNNLISSFSSAGFSADGRIKPDVSAMGVLVPLQTTVTTVTRASGTSFSCPVVSGMAASLMHAVPKATGNDVLMAIRASSDRINSPDSLYGYGIPDMMKALTLLQEKYVAAEPGNVVAAPNPTTGIFDIFFGSAPERISIEIVTLDGKLIYRRDYQEYAGRMIRITQLQQRENGMYLVRINSAEGTRVLRVIKIKD